MKNAKKLKSEIY